jgi:hypothetical protein
MVSDTLGIPTKAMSDRLLVTKVVTTFSVRHKNTLLQ